MAHNMTQHHTTYPNQASTYLCKTHGTQHDTAPHNIPQPSQHPPLQVTELCGLSLHYSLGLMPQLLQLLLDGTSQLVLFFRFCLQLLALPPLLLGHLHRLAQLLAL